MVLNTLQNRLSFLFYSYIWAFFLSGPLYELKQFLSSILNWGFGVIWPDSVVFVMVNMRLEVGSAASIVKWGESLFESSSRSNLNTTSGFSQRLRSSLEKG